MTKAVGSLRSKEQLDYLLANNIYYIPLQQSVVNHNLEYIAIFQSKSKFEKENGIKYYGKIKNIEIAKRKEIDFPSTKSGGDEDYLIFEVERWLKLGKKIRAEGYGVSGSHIYSNLMLLKKADSLPELSIRSLKEWRLWLELKRLKEEIQILIKEDNLDEIKEIEGFKISDLEVIIDKEQLMAASDVEVVEYSYEKFLKNPRSILNEIMELMES